MKSNKRCGRQNRMRPNDHFSLVGKLEASRSSRRHLQREQISRARQLLKPHASVETLGAKFVQFGKRAKSGEECCRNWSVGARRLRLLLSSAVCK